MIKKIINISCINFNKSEKGLNTHQTRIHPEMNLTRSAHSNNNTIDTNK